MAELHWADTERPGKGLAWVGFNKYQIKNRRHKMPGMFLKQTKMEDKTNSPGISQRDHHLHTSTAQSQTDNMD